MEKIAFSRMRTLWLFILLLLVSSIGCDHTRRNSPIKRGECGSPVNTSHQVTATPYESVQMALLGTRFTSFEELKTVIRIEYFPGVSPTDSAGGENTMDSVRHCSNGQEVISVLASGISQGEIREARIGDFWDRLHVLFKSPYAVTKRGELSKVHLLARRRNDLFGEGDPAFYDLAESAAKN